jgi:PPOX class probable F420-dependent enzyme
VNLTAVEIRSLLGQARVARLATASASGRPHLVPVTFALDIADNSGITGSTDRIYIAIDHKQKTTTNLKRIRNIQENPAVSLLADHYAEDWATLWWARADGQAHILPAGDPGRDRPLDLLTGKYPQYAERRPNDQVIVIVVSHWTGWASA